MTLMSPIVGQRATWTRTLGPDEVEAFARLTGDRNPLHFDPALRQRRGWAGSSSRVG